VWGTEAELCKYRSTKSTRSTLPSIPNILCLRHLNMGKLPLSIKGPPIRTPAWAWGLGEAGRHLNLVSQHNQHMRPNAQ
jgi:hypothetical protein